MLENFMGALSVIVMGNLKFCMLTYIYTLVFVRLVPHFMLYDSPLQCDFNIFKKLFVCPI